MLIYTVVYTYPSDRKNLVLSVQTVTLQVVSSQLMLIDKKKKCNHGKKKRHFPHLTNPIDISTKRCM